MKKILLLVLCAGTLHGFAQKPEKFAKTITAEDLKKHLFVIAGPEMEGRETATPGQKKAAAYIESQFKSLGLAPGNHGDYQLQYPVYQDSLAKATIEVNEKPFELDKDFTITVGQSHTFSARFSEVAFVGNGISDS